MQIADKDKVIEFHCGIIYRTDRTMERLRLWRYRKLANENVKEDKVIEKQSDDEDYNSCFKLKRNLKVRVLFFKLLIYNNASDVKQRKIKQRSIRRRTN